jgi:hypothetical protein
MDSNNLLQIKNLVYHYLAIGNDKKTLEFIEQGLHQSPEYGELHYFYGLCFKQNVHLVSFTFTKNI